MQVELDNALAVVAIAVAAAAVWLSWRALKSAEQAAYADMLLRLDDRARTFDEIHRKLRPGGAWADGLDGPKCGDEWADVDGYMGLFERMNFLVDRKLIAIDYVEEFYGYRYDNIVAHRGIRSAKLEGEERASWGNFEELGERLRAYRTRGCTP